MRSLASILVAGGIFIGFAGAANAAAIIEIEFVSSGTPTVTVAPSASVTANIFLDLTAEPLGSQGISFTIEWDTLLQNNLNLVGSSECGALAGDGAGCVPANVGPWDLHITPGVTPVTVESTTGGVAGQHGSFSVANLLPVGAGGGLRSLVGTITFHAKSPHPSSTNVTPIFRFGEQVNDDTGFGSIPTTLIGGVVNIVPEPMTFALVSLGLLGLGIAGRRRQ